MDAEAPQKQKARHQRKKAPKEESEGNDGNPKKEKPEPKKPRKHFSECNLDDFFLTSKVLNDEDFYNLEDAIEHWKLGKCVSELAAYFKDEEKLNKTLEKSHEVLAKCLKDSMKPVLLQSYLTVLSKHPERVKKLCVMQEIQKIEKQVHNYDYAFFCAAFGLSIAEEKAVDILRECAANGAFVPGFKLIEVAKLAKDKQKVNILVSGARKNEMKQIAEHLIKLGYCKEDYREVHEQLLIDAIFYHFNNDGYEHVEEIYRPHPKILAIVLNKMLQSKKTINQALSVCARNPDVIHHLKNPKQVSKMLRELHNIIPNSLLTDTFGPSDPKKFLSFAEFHLTEKDVLFLDEEHPGIERILSRLFSDRMIGIDTESLVARTKFDQELDLLATLQIANSREAYLLDPIKANKPHIVKYLKEFVENPDNIIVGHTVDADLDLLLKSFGITTRVCKVVELKRMFEKLFPKEKLGLANMCLQVLGKPLCKKYTLTDWGRRPLLKNQIHYAAMDAFIVVVLFTKMSQMLEDANKQKTTP